MTRSTGNAYQDELNAKGDNAAPPFPDPNAPDTLTYDPETGMFRDLAAPQRVAAGGPARRDVQDADSLGNVGTAQPLGPTTSNPKE